MGRIIDALEQISESLKDWPPITERERSLAETIREQAARIAQLEADPGLARQTVIAQEELMGMMREQISTFNAKTAAMEDESAILHIAVATLRAAVKPLSEATAPWGGCPSIGEHHVLAAAEALAATSGEGDQGGMTPEEREGMEVDISNANTISEQAERIADLERDNRSQATRADAQYVRIAELEATNHRLGGEVRLQITDYRKQQVEIADLQSKITVLEDESAALHIAVATLRAALKPMAEKGKSFPEYVHGDAMREVALKLLRAAAEALAATSGEEPQEPPITTVETLKIINTLQRVCEVVGCPSDEDVAQWVVELKAKATESDGWFANLQKMQGELTAKTDECTGLESRLENQRRTLSESCTASRCPGDRLLVTHLTKMRSQLDAKAAVQAAHDRLVAEAAEGTDG